MQLTAAREPAITYLPGREPVHARHARKQARALLTAWGLGQHADLGELIAGELIANAIRHGEGQIWMRFSIDGRDLRVEVHDDGAGRPARKQAGDEDESGRGLELLDGLIELHGTGERGVISDPAGPGKIVYVVLTLEAALAGPLSSAPAAGAHGSASGSEHPVTADCQVECLAPLLPARVLNRLAHARDRSVPVTPCGPPATVVVRLYRQGRLGKIAGLGVQAITQIGSCLIFAGLDLDASTPRACQPTEDSPALREPAD